MSGFSNGQMIKPESGHLKFIWPHVYFFIFPRPRKRSPLFHTEERPHVLWILKCAFGMCLPFCGLLSGGSFGLVCVQGHLRLLTQQDATFQQEGLPRKTLHFSQGGYCVSLLLCFLRDMHMRMVESQVVPEGGKEAVSSLEVAAP